MEATRGEYTPKEGASLKTQNNGKKKRGKNQQCKMVRIGPFTFIFKQYETSG